MGMFSNFVAGAAGQAADYTQKTGLQDQMNAAELLKAQRIQEMHQRFKISDEERGRANDLKAGQDIESTAKGMLAANQPPKPGVSNDGTLTVDGAGLDPNQKSSRLDTLQAKADAAESKGYFKQANEIRQQIQVEVNNKRADNQETRYDDQNALQRDQLKETSRHNKALENSRAEQIMHQYETGALKAQLAAATAEQKLPKQVELTMKARLDSIEKVFTDTVLDEAGRKERIAAINKTYGPALVKQVETKDNGETIVKSWDGRTESFPNLQAARESFGLSGPAAKATPAASASSPISDTLKNIGGMIGSAAKGSDYTPPADSPAAKMIANRDAKSKSDKAAVDAAFNTAEDLTTKALQSNSIADARAAQDSPGFKYLPQSYQSKIYKLVNGR